MSRHPNLSDGCICVVQYTNRQLNEHIASRADTVQQSGVLTIVHLQQLVQKINEIIAEYADADML